MVRYFIALLALSLCVCVPPAENTLVVISPHSPEIRHEFSVGFSSWYKEKTGAEATVKWLDVGGTGESIEYIRSRNSESRQAGGVDVFFGGGNYPFIKLKSMGLLLPHSIPSQALAKIPREIMGSPVYQEDSTWYGAAVSSFGIVYNKEILRRNNLPVPATWRDLADPACYGWISSGDPRYSGSIHMMYEILLQAYGWVEGWQVLSLVASNVQTFTKGAGLAAKYVSAGQAAMGLAIDFYAFIEIERYGADRLGFILPEGETVINADGIGIIANGPRPDLARIFLDYVLSDGQKLWILKAGKPGGPLVNPLCRFPVDTSLYSLPTFQRSIDQNPFKLESTLHYDGKTGGRRWALLGDLVAAYLITPHSDLKKCRSKAISEGLTPEEYLRYFTIELTEDKAFEHADKWADREFAQERIKLMNSWTRAAIARYRSIGKGN